MERKAGALPRLDRAGPRRRGHPAGPVGRPRPRRAEDGQAAVQGPGLPGADAAGRRPGPPVPLHLRASRSTWPSSCATPRPRPSTSPGSRCRRSSTGSCRWATSGSCPLEDVIGEHLKKLFPGMDVLESHIFRVTRNEDLEVEEDDAENLLKALEKELLRRRFGPPVRLEVEESMEPRVLDLLISELGVSAEGGLPPARAARPDRPARHRRPGSRGPEVPRVRAHHPPPARGGRVGVPGRRVRVRAPPRRAPAPPLRLLRDVGAALPRAGGGRPVRAGDQADALSHLRRQPDHRCARRCRRGRQAGAGDRGDQGPLRRAGQHPLGPQARARRLPRGLRPGRPQDALQARDGGARRARRHPPLHPHRHRQLQPQDRPALRGHRPDHGRRGDRRGRRPPVQQPVRALAQHLRTTRCSSPRTRCATG